MRRPDDKHSKGYVGLAEMIVEGTCRSYERALEQYERFFANSSTLRARQKAVEIHTIEKDLLSPYFAVLTLGVLNMQEFVDMCRKKHKFVPIFDEILRCEHDDKRDENMPE